MTNLCKSLNDYNVSTYLCLDFCLYALRELLSNYEIAGGSQKHAKMAT